MKRLLLLFLAAAWMAFTPLLSYHLQWSTVIEYPKTMQYPSWKTIYPAYDKFKHRGNNEDTIGLFLSPFQFTVDSASITYIPITPGNEPVTTRELVLPEELLTGKLGTPAIKTMVLDSQHDLYVIGEFSQESPAMGPSLSETTLETNALFVAKIARDGNLIWVQSHRKSHSYSSTEPDQLSYVWLLNDAGMYVLFNTTGKEKQDEEKLCCGIQTDLVFFAAADGAKQAQTLFTEKPHGTKTADEMIFQPQRSYCIDDHHIILMRVHIPLFSRNYYVQYGILEVQ